MSAIGAIGLGDAFLGGFWTWLNWRNVSECQKIFGSTQKEAPPTTQRKITASACLLGSASGLAGWAAERGVVSVGAKTLSMLSGVGFVTATIAGMMEANDHLNTYKEVCAQEKKAIKLGIATKEDFSAKKTSALFSFVASTSFVIFSLASLAALVASVANALFFTALAQVSLYVGIASLAVACISMGSDRSDRVIEQLKLQEGVA